MRIRVSEEQYQTLLKAEGEHAEGWHTERLNSETFILIHLPKETPE
jgi:hypothetical protein